MGIATTTTTVIAPDQTTVAQFTLDRMPHGMSSHSAAHPRLAYTMVETYRAKDSAGVGLNNVFGTPLNMAAQAGRQWYATVDSMDADALKYMQDMLGMVHFAAAKVVIAQLGLTVTDADLGAAVQAVSAKGLTVEHYITTEIEKLEVARQGGTAPFVHAAGDAPMPAPTP